MKRNSKLVKATRNFYQKLCSSSPLTIKEQSLWLLRAFLITRKQPEWVNAGFVLPTVAMVALVVVLLTTAILFRSFERSKNASNVRVNEAVLNAATPALERAKSKLNKLLQDPRLPRSTPSDFSLHQVIAGNINQFTFGDETQLKVVADINKNGSIETATSTLDQEETLTTAWKYPVDTDNNGKFDSFTLYGVYFRSPLTDRPRSPLEARTPPMNENNKAGQCDAGGTTSAQLVGTQGWYKRGGTLKRSIFVYTTTVPITNTAGLPTSSTPGYTGSLYETFKGNKGFAALEYQQDRERIPISNNAVLYNDDLEISPGGGLRLNGRIVTNSNLLTGQPFDPVRFFLVSSPQSCYYNEANSKIVVGGNVANGGVIRTNDVNTSTSSGVRVDYFKLAGPGGSDFDYVNSTNKTTTGFGNKVAYNSRAFEMRIKLLVDAAMSVATLPQEVSQEIQRKTSVDSSLDATAVKREQLEIYFRKRTRRVPYAEVDITDPVAKALEKTAGVNYTVSDVLQGSGDTLRPPDKWIFPYAPSDGTTHAGYANLSIKTNASDTTKIYLPASATKFPEPQGDEAKIGDRIVAGNNLPEIWWNGTKFVGQQDGEAGGQEILNKSWDAGTGTRKRFPQVKQLDDLGITDRDDFWEKKAAEQAQGVLDVVGGLRVITGAGIYKRAGSYLPAPATAPNDPNTTVNESSLPVVWSDSMPMWKDTDNDSVPETTDERNDLVMRTTVVYHYKTKAYDPQAPTVYQTPIACVSSYYDPSTSRSATNTQGLPDIRIRDASPNTVWSTTGLTTKRDLTLTSADVVSAGAAGRSNNGIVYTFSGAQASTISGISETSGVFSYASGAEDPANSTIALKDRLSYQANLVFPNGRFVNEPLRKALLKISASKSLTLSEQSAVDAAICGIKLIDGSTMTVSDSVIPHGAIRETTFLDARQVKRIDRPGTGNATSYNLDVELRQPLEIRTTVLDLDLLRRKSIDTGEFLLPNSGIIYATRDDALPDISDPTSLSISGTDFTLDATRRPNAIMLINGSDLSRNSNYKPEEKGLILASNLPVYIKGNFNRHTQEEFYDGANATLKDDWSNFYNRGNISNAANGKLNPNFACRPGQFTDCSTGETWRPTTLLADAITILSNNFREGFRNEGDYDLNDNAGNFPVGGYDLNAVNGIVPTEQSSINETVVQLDLNGDNSITNTTVSLNENQVSALLAARLNGFWDNNFVTSLPWYENGLGNPSDLNNQGIKSSYFNNFVTPIQRRTIFPEFVMEICRKPTIAQCGASDWTVGYKSGATVDWTYKARNSAVSGNKILENYQVDQLGAGSTARPALNSEDRLYPRRIAFLRDENDKLVLDASGRPTVLGIDKASASDSEGSSLTVGSSQDNAGKVKFYPFETYSSTNRPRLHSRALWFKTRHTDGSANYGHKYPLWIANTLPSAGGNKSDQPLLVPVLQIQIPLKDSDTDIAATSDNYLNNQNNVKDTTNNWLQNVTEDTVETNLAFVQGDTPGRPTESNGGLENFVRYLENWSSKKHKALGAFIQYKRSSFATAPWQVFTASYNAHGTGFSTTGTIFGYPQGYRINVNNTNNLGRTPFYVPPNRAWGFDVALLTQLPDLFSQRFTSPVIGDPNEFYREIGRDDPWVESLLCAAQSNAYTNNGNFGDAPSTKYGSNFRYAITNDQRPSACRN